MVQEIARSKCFLEWDTIQNSINRLKKIEDILEIKINSYTKKEVLRFENSAQKLNKALGGIKNMVGKPDILFIIDTNKEILAVKEANKMGRQGKDWAVQCTLCKTSLSS